jgi:RNA polymerase sigma-70 factor, ECF subfamily
MEEICPSLRSIGTTASFSEAYSPKAVEMMDELTLRRAKDGDSEAFEALVTPYERMIWRLCWRYVRHDADAQDCVQETMLKAWRQLPQYRGECSVESWLYRICVSCCLDFLRRRGNRNHESVDVMTDLGLDPVSPEPQPEEKVLAEAEKQEIHEAISDLPQTMQEVLVLNVLEGRSYEDTAALIGISIGTVKSRLNRARQKLQEKFSRLGTKLSSSRLTK